MDPLAQGQVEAGEGEAGVSRGSAFPGRGVGTSNMLSSYRQRVDELLGTEAVCETTLNPSQSTLEDAG